MIDWFVSKIGIIVFVIAASAALLAFANTQVGIMETEAAAQAANTFANLADKICEGCSTTLSFDRTYNITLGERKVTVRGITRTIYSDTVESSVLADSVRISRTGGVVSVQKA